jgi:hypothetical protein
MATILAEVHLSGAWVTHIDKLKNGGRFFRKGNHFEWY